MAQSGVSYAPSKEWVESTIVSINKTQVPSPRTSLARTNRLDQKLSETDPERCREYLKEIEREQRLAIPQAQTDGEQWARMEANAKALIDHDPELSKVVDMERMKSSVSFVNKVKVRLAIQHLPSLTNTANSNVSSPVLRPTMSFSRRTRTKRYRCLEMAHRGDYILK